MPRSRRKRSPSCEVDHVVFAGGVEVISVDIVAGKTIKKRTFEKVHFEDPVLNDLTSSSLDNDTTDTIADTGSKGPSRSVSVRTHPLLAPEARRTNHQPCRRKSKNGCRVAKNSWMSCFVWRVSVEA